MKNLPGWKVRWNNVCNFGMLLMFILFVSELINLQHAEDLLGLFIYTILPIILFKIAKWNE